MSRDGWVPKDLPSGWAAPRIRDLCVVIRGASPRPMGDPRYFGGSIPFVKIADVTRSDGMTVYDTDTKVTPEGALRSRRIPAGRLILTNSATVCVPVFLGVDACIHDGFVAFETLPEFINQRFLYYFFKYIRPYVLNDHKQGVTQVNLNTDIVGDIRLLLPPSNEQGRIVAKIEGLLSEIGKGVESLKTGQEQIKVYQKAFLKNAFEGKLTANWRARNKHELRSPSELKARIASELQGRHANALNVWKRSLEHWNTKALRGMRPVKPRSQTFISPPTKEELAQFPSLPECWQWVKLGELVWSVRDGPHYSPKYTLEGIPFISGGNIKPSGIDFASTKYISPELHQELCERCKPEKGDILYTKGGTTGIARANTYDREFNVWVHVAVLKIVTSIRPLYLQHALNSPLCYGQSQKYTHGVGNQDLGLTRLINILIPLCSETEQQKMEEIVEESTSEFDHIEIILEQELGRSDLLRQAVLKKAFTGQLVAQDPSDEPAPVLLARIVADKEHAGNYRGKNNKKSGKKEAA